MPKPTSHDISYLLRCWRVQDYRQYSWVVCAQSTATGEQRMFPSIEALLQFLQAEFGECGSVDDSECQEPIDAGPES
jgi:hypothetical protein